MPEAGWLLLFLFLGGCSLIMVALLWPSFRRIQQGVPSTQTAQAPSSPTFTETTPLSEKTEREAAQSVRPPVLAIRDWLSIVNERPDDAPHTLIIGPSGTGKTTLAQAIATTRSGYIVILDPKWTPGRWGGLRAIPIDDDGKYSQIETAIKSLLAELTSRLVSLKQGVETFDELTIIAEELPTLISECPSAATLFKQMGRLGRELRIRLIGLSQSERVKSLGISGEGDAINNYTLIRLGKAAITVVPEARSMSRPAVLAWRGENYLMNISGILYLAHCPIHDSRSWSLETRELQQSQQQGSSSNGDGVTHESELQFTLEEVCSIASLIVSGTERLKAIRSMPGYKRSQHKEFAAYYERLRQAMTDVKEVVDSKLWERT